MDRKNRRKKGRLVLLISPWGRDIGKPSYIAALAGRRPMARAVTMAIKLLRRFLDRNVERCGEVVEVITNARIESIIFKTQNKNLSTKLKIGTN